MASQFFVTLRCAETTDYENNYRNMVTISYLYNVWHFLAAEKRSNLELKSNFVIIVD